MIWLAWRQQRLALLALGGYALVAIAVMVYHRFAMPAQLTDEELRLCAESLTASCRLSESGWNAASAFRETAEGVRFGLIGFAALAGLFLGAPALAREWEQHTHLLVLSQQVGPRRWFAAKVAVIAVPATLGAALLGATYLWWTSGLGALAGSYERLQVRRFEVHPLALASYTLFAVALGIVVGLAVRRVVPAMALTLAVWAGALYSVRWFVRPHYQTPVVSTTPLTEAGQTPADRGRWTIGHGYADRTGDFVDVDTALEIERACRAASTDQVGQCMAGHGLVKRAALVHPGDRFWLFQGIEATLFTVLSAALVIGAMWWLRKRFR
ncbi:hypothetical protein ABZ816_14620 [Actinosynnema sp. NPDC047251]|uniref:Putative membrane protein n=1 Tax=Saccharothrix espanaensis (strain ATCC 51144 / DSM 44229 / JCM 9112 / NBRC 15066 / NRRL 15764) TaxID=1179773 RepID=K0JYG0_SACES|nr:hypothetical protein [Saccharothrix espanaensis]CCH29744.1 putative membrane protein [Saccharothrix espanaensis DSM 44229]